MNIVDILPVAIPGFVIQFLIQVYFIKHCWGNKDLLPKQKMLYIIAIALLNAPAAAVYLLLTRKKTVVINKNIEDTEIDSNIKQGIFVLLIIAFELLAFRIIGQNIENSDYSLIIALLGVCFVTTLVNGLIIKKKHGVFYYLLPAAMIFLIMPIEYLDTTYSAQLIVLVVIACIINGFPLLLSRIYSICSFTIYFFVNCGEVLKQSGESISDEAIGNMYINLLIFLLVFFTFYNLKKQLLANKQLENALITLKEQSLQLEQMSAIAERSRIAGEIHDTVGHMLTSAVISIEAGEKLLDINKEGALEKFSLAKEQVKHGLGDIRNSVKAIHTGAEKAFAPALETLLTEIYHNTGLRITHVIKISSELLPIQQNVLLSAIKECSTNSLKHGRSTVADLLLQEYKGHIWMTFSDNGSGSDSVESGFGLRNMTERVESLGGVLNVESIKGEGFTVSISIPVGMQTGGKDK